MNFFNFFSVDKNTVFEKKIEIIIVSTVSSITQKFFCAIWNHVTKFVTLRSLLKIFKKIEKIHMDSDKLMNLFEMKKRIVTRLFMGQLFVFGNLLKTFWHYYYAKYIFLISKI